MSYCRKPRKNGETLVLGGVTYYLDQLEGMGGSSIVYRGRYEDALSRGQYHQVLIRELFPWHSRGAVYRDENGGISCTESGRALMEAGRRRFLQGNEANLELLEQMPSRTSGNLNSYEAYGTYYSVLSVHGGETLEALLEDGRGPENLLVMAVILKNILNALECFHKKELLHLDISPDNILLLPGQAVQFDHNDNILFPPGEALLIDYNSVWNRKQTPERDFFITVKEGYSAPEVQLGQIQRIGCAADLYSVCAVFFRMLTGRLLRGEDIWGNGLRACLAGGIPVLEKEPVSVRCRVMQILAKGLHVLPGKRYQTAADFRNDVDELMDLICRAGVSQAALWEAGRNECRLQRKEERPFLPRTVRLEGGSRVSVQELLEFLCSGANVLLTAPGGMGKTWLLQKLWEMGTAWYDPRRPAFFYLSLREYQESGEPFYIRNALLGRLSVPGGGGAGTDAARELDKLLRDCPAGQVRLVLLLDGLNEAGSACRPLLKEIEELGMMDGVSILITDRTDEVLGYALKRFPRAGLEALDAAQVQEELHRLGVDKNGGGKLGGLLSNPLMLRLYGGIVTIRKEERGTEGFRQDEPVLPAAGSMGGDGNIQNDLIREYLGSLLKGQFVADSGDSALQLCHRYILEHLLPAIALEMSRKKRTILSFDQLYAVVRKNYRRLKQKSFCRCFPDYLGKSRRMLLGIRDESEWFDFSVNEQLIRRLGLLVRSESGFYHLIHDNFQECLTESARQNRSVYQKQIGRAAGVRAAAAAVLCGMALFGTGKVLKERRAREQALALQREAADQVVFCVKENLGVLSDLIAAQKTLMNIAGEPDTLKGTESGLLSFEATKSSIQSVPVYFEEVEESVKREILREDPEYPADYLEFLCREPEQLDKSMNSAFLWIELALKNEGDSEADFEERRKMVEAYDAYLEAYAEYIFYVADYTLLCTEPESVESMLEGETMRYPWILEPYYVAARISEQEPGDLRQVVQELRKKVEAAESFMNECGYEVYWEELI